MNTLKKCLFPVAGYGTRFLPATKAIPKEMLPILTKPLLQYGVEEAISAGIRNMSIVTGRGKRAIEDHFDNSFEIESQLRGTPKEFHLKEIKEVIEKTTFTYVRQKKMLGLGHAILTGGALIGNESFAVILPDDLCINDGDSVLHQLTNISQQFPDSCIIAIEEVSKSLVNQYGIISGHLIDDFTDLYQVDHMEEKPNIDEAPSNLAIVGRYILTPNIFKILEDTKPDMNGEIQITDALNKLAKVGKVIAYKFNGSRYDCGSVKGFVHATNYFAKINKIFN